MKKLLLIAFAGLICLNANAQGRYRQMELSGGVAYGFGLMDFSRLEDIYTVSLWYSYWMNDTSTVDVGISYLQSKYTINVNNYGLPGGIDRPNWNMFTGVLGASYRPKWDFMIDFGFGGGLGYEQWDITGSKFGNRSGGGLIYYLLADAEYPIRPWLSVGAYLQPFFLPLGERLEKTATVYPNGTTYLGYDTLANSVILNTGVWLSVRIF